jgi:hypothetical protein
MVELKRIDSSPQAIVVLNAFKASNNYQVLKGFNMCVPEGKM